MNIFDSIFSEPSNASDAMKSLAGSILSSLTDEELIDCNGFFEASIVDTETAMWEATEETSKLDAWGFSLSALHRSRIWIQEEILKRADAAEAEAASEPEPQKAPETESDTPIFDNTAEGLHDILKSLFPDADISVEEMRQKPKTSEVKTPTLSEFIKMFGFL